MTEDRAAFVTFLPNTIRLVTNTVITATIMAIGKLISAALVNADLRKMPSFQT